MIKLVVSDIDGTLVPEGTNQIDPEYFKWIRGLKRQGILFAAASGREYKSMQRLLNPVAEDVLFIADNGANVILREKSISVNYIGQELAGVLLLFLRDLPGCEIMLSAPESVYLETTDEEFADMLIHGYRFRIKRVRDLLPLCGRAIKIAAYSRTGIQPAFQTIASHFGDRMNVTLSGMAWADCMSLTTDKGNALEKLQYQMGISRDETMAFGDNCNDIQMLRHAAESYAVGNAHPRLKEVARHIAPPCTENGVLKTLQAYFDIQ
ncbi:MAG: Cof-type HAD-IIB family hydrolase [Lachnospiraceae bacterium]|nr:Cof-type HAD-IIB family hydrolase [Lachnospiraceae bacterium]